MPQLSAWCQNKSWSLHSLSYLEIDCLNVNLSHYFLWETWASPRYWMDFSQNSLKIFTTDFSHFVLTRSRDAPSICDLCMFHVWGKNSINLFTIIFLILHYLSQNFISVSRQKKMFFWVNNNVRSEDRDTTVRTRHHIVRIVKKIYLLSICLLRKVYL